MKKRTSPVVRIIAFLSCALPLLLISAAAQRQAESFDKPIKDILVDLGVSPYYAAGPYKRHGQLRCHYFPGFVVKELDRVQKGDDWISISSNGPDHMTPCAQEHAEGETHFPSDDGDVGYFGGVKGRFIFLNAADCFDSGCPFGVFEASTRGKVFADQVRLSKKGVIAEVRFARRGGKLVMRYPRVVSAECSLPQKKSECWKEIHRTTGIVPQPMPKCIGYNSLNRSEGYGTEDQTDPSVVSFPVEVTIPDFKRQILPGPVTCWAAD